MKSGFCIALAAVAAQAFIACGSPAAPLEAYGRLPSIERVSISPDGRKLAVIVTSDEERHIAIRTLADGSTKVLRAGNAKVRDLNWAGPNHLLVTSTATATIPFIRAPRSEWATSVDYDLTTGKMRQLLRGGIKGSTDSLNVTFGSPSVRIIKGKPVVFLVGIEFVAREGRAALFRVDLESGREEMINAGYPETLDWLVGPDGEPLAQSLYDPKSGRWSIRTATDAGWRQLHAVDAPIERPWLAGLGRDGTSILVSEWLDGTNLLREVQPSAPVWGDPFRHRLFDETILDSQSERLVGLYTLVGEEDRYEFFDPLDTAVWRKVTRLYEGQRVSLVDWSLDRNRVVVRVDSPSEGPFYALVDIDAGKAGSIGRVYESLTAADISAVRLVSYKARDGLEISGYLTLPKGRPARDLPLVVLPHGGPESRDEPGFDWWSQALASRGYAVLQPNFRGSSGFSLKFTEAGYGEWGRKMQTDLSDGIHYLVAEGTVDPQRVCIVGASYGGYAALAGAAFDAANYRCAASVAGPSELRRMVRWSKQKSGERSQRYWTRFMGAEDPDDPILQAVSPALHADKIAIPVLLVHGKDDTVVPLEQSRIMEKALKEAGNPAETLIMDGEDHWLSRGETRLQMLKTLVTFLETHNPPQ
jgi:dipeptidyl aminopeptidase/acylaminoacyl peptidase